MDTLVRQAFNERNADLKTGLIQGTDLHGYHNSREREWRWVKPMIGKKYGAVTPIIYDPDHKMLDVILPYYKPEERVCAERMIKNNTGYSVIAECDCGRIWYPHTYHLRYKKLFHCPYCDTTRYKPPASKLLSVRDSRSMFKSRLYTMYRNMISKCYNPKSEGYDKFGKKGIRVSELWYNPDNITDRFRYFVAWALDHGYYEQNPEEYDYSSMLIIDRIDRDGDFTPENTVIGERRELSQINRDKPQVRNITLKKRPYMDPYNWKCIETPDNGRFKIDDVVYATNTVKALFGITVDGISSRMNNNDWEFEDSWQIPTTKQLKHLRYLGDDDIIIPDLYDGPRYDKYGILRDDEGFAILIKRQDWLAKTIEEYEHIYTIDDVEYNLVELLDTFHLPYTVFKMRLELGWSVYDAVTIPQKKVIIIFQCYLEGSINPKTYTGYRYDKHGILRDKDGFVKLIPKVKEE